VPKISVCAAAGAAVARSKQQAIIVFVVGNIGNLRFGSLG
jgi:hypothetical protein